MRVNDFNKFNKYYPVFKKILPLKFAYILATTISTTII